MVDFPAALLCAFLALLAAFLHGCGGAPAPTPAPGPAGPQVYTAPDPADMTFKIPPHSNFHCIKKFDKPTGYEAGFFMFRWTSKTEAESATVDTDTFGDINPYYLLTSLMTNTGGSPPPATKQGGCTIPHCGIKGGGGCVLERVFIKMNNEKTKDVLVNAGIWGPYMTADNGITDVYSYWGFNWTGVKNPLNCKAGLNSPTCNFYFEGGYPVGCQRLSDVGDSPVWYSTTAACPQYPFDDKAGYPESHYPWHKKLDPNDPVSEACRRTMPGGNHCGGPNGTKGDPWTTPSKTCTWQTKKAGYLTLEDVFNIEHPEPPSVQQNYEQWCKEQHSISDWGYDTGIPTGITLFYGLSDVAHPELKGIRAKAWHDALAVDNKKAPDHLTPAQIVVFQNWAKSTKARLNAMFDEMDKQAFAEFNKNSQVDPDGSPYTDCLSNADTVAPECTQGAPPPSAESVLI